MSLHRRNPKRDHNELAIVEVLQKRGFHVDRVSAPGFPDLVATKHGCVWFIEVKRPKGGYTAKQIEWRSRWTGPEIYCIRSVDEASTFPESYALANSVPDSGDRISASATRKRRA